MPSVRLIIYRMSVTALIQWLLKNKINNINTCRKSKFAKNDLK